MIPSVAGLPWNAGVTGAIGAREIGNYRDRLAILRDWKDPTTRQSRLSGRYYYDDTVETVESGAEKRPNFNQLVEHPWTVLKMEPTSFGTNRGCVIRGRNSSAMRAWRRGFVNLGWESSETPRKIPEELSLIHI